LRYWRFARASPDASERLARGTRSRFVALLRLGDLDGAETLERRVDEEDLHGDVGLDVGLAACRQRISTVAHLAVFHGSKSPYGPQV
jgi:hypothetical protein